MATCAARVSPPDLVALRQRFMVEPTSYAFIVGVDHELCVEAISRRLDALWRMSGVGLNAAGGRVVFRIDNDETFGGIHSLSCSMPMAARDAFHSWSISLLPSSLSHHHLNRRQPLA
jgi:hypothetical protein